MNLSIVHTTIWKEIVKRVKKKIGFVIDDRNAAGGCAYRVFRSGRIAGGSEE